jgi:anti-sigma regulatory factor (Ser/Thr protein kinase)
MLDGWLSSAVGNETAELVRLAASELATNVFRHGGLSAGSSMRLVVDVDDAGVQVEVEQASTARDAAMVAPRDRLVSGFGLAIVDDVADRWGIEAGPPGSVWFHVGIPSDRSDGEPTG